MTKSNNSNNSTSRSPRRTKPLPGRKKRSELQGETLLEALDRLKITEWDLCIVGDGSGTGWTDYCGWGATLVEKLTRARRTFYGGMNVGSVNLAELMPYVHAISWYHAKHGADRLKRANGVIRVQVLTDSQYLVTESTKVFNDGPFPKKQVGLWAALRQFQREGYCFDFRWIPRETLALNWFADLMAGNSRAAIKDLELTDKEGDAISPYEFNSL